MNERIKKLRQHPHYIMSDEIKLMSGGTFVIKDHRGFTVAYIDESGNFYHKGDMRKLRISYFGLNYGNSKSRVTGMRMLGHMVEFIFAVSVPHCHSAALHHKCVNWFALNHPIIPSQPPFPIRFCSIGHCPTDRPSL